MICGSALKEDVKFRLLGGEEEGGPKGHTLPQRNLTTGIERSRQILLLHMFPWGQTSSLWS